MVTVNGQGPSENLELTKGEGLGFFSVAFIVGGLTLTPQFLIDFGNLFKDVDRLIVVEVIFVYGLEFLEMLLHSLGLLKYLRQSC